jgi:hypothetical protein
MGVGPWVAMLRSTAHLGQLPAWLCLFQGHCWCLLGALPAL